MARIGEKRVSQVVDYERDIKGKRLIRLSAGVGSGKNYWICEIAKKYPDLRILLVTSRINIVNAQAKKLKAQTFINIDELTLNDENGESCRNEKYKRVACTNARIEHFIKNKYSESNPTTHIWNYFDLIVVDEVHSLTLDATFSDSPFYIANFIKQAYMNNPNCDIIFMSGTQEPIDWFFRGLQDITTNIDCFKECIHLEPNNVILNSNTNVIPQLKNFLDQGKRIIYFANYIKSISSIVDKLVILGVSPDVFGFSFNYDSDDIKRFPETMRKELPNKINSLNEHLTTNEILPDNVQILFTTSKNKEGITISNDDIKIMFVESRNKYDIKQMAGRVRGNPDNGEGIEDLYIIYDAHQFCPYIDEYDVLLEQNSINTANSTLADYYQFFIHCETPFNLNAAISKCEKSFRYVRYDYFKELFSFYDGKLYADNINYKFYKELEDIIDAYETDSNDKYVKNHFQSQWFPFSNISLIPPSSPSDIAKSKLSKYLESKDFIYKKIDRKQHDEIKEFLIKLTNKYSCKDIGIKKPLEDNSKLKSALEKFGYTLNYGEHGKKYYIVPK